MASGAGGVAGAASVVLTLTNPTFDEDETMEGVGEQEIISAAHTGKLAWGSETDQGDGTSAANLGHSVREERGVTVISGVDVASSDNIPAGTRKTCYIAPIALTGASLFSLVATIITFVAKQYLGGGALAIVTLLFAGTTIYVQRQRSKHDLRVQVQTLTKERKQLEVKLAELDTLLGVTEGEIQKTTEALHSNHQQELSLETHLGDKVEQVKQQRAHLNQSIENFKKLADLYKEAMTALKSFGVDVDALQTKVHDIGVAANRLDQEEDDIEAVTASFTKQLDALEDNGEAFEKQTELFQKLATTYHNRMSAVESQIQLLLDRVAQLKQEGDETQAAALKSSRSTSDLTAALREAGDTLADLTLQVPQGHRRGHGGSTMGGSKVVAFSSDDGPSREGTVLGHTGVSPLTRQTSGSSVRSSASILGGGATTHLNRSGSTSSMSSRGSRASVLGGGRTTQLSRTNSVNSRTSNASVLGGGNVTALHRTGSIASHQSGGSTLGTAHTTALSASRDDLLDGEHGGVVASNLLTVPGAGSNESLDSDVTRHEDSD